MKEELQDRIDEYLLNRMSDEERLAFEKEVDSNKELQEQLSFTQNVQQAVKSRNDKLAKMGEWEKEAKREDGHRSGRQIYYWLSGIAALLVIGMFALSEYLSPIFRSTITESHPNEYQMIEKRLADNDFDKALEEIEKAEYEIIMQDKYKMIEVDDTVAPDSFADYETETVVCQAERIEVPKENHGNRNESYLDKRDDNVTDDVIDNDEDTHKFDDIYRLDSVENPEKKNQLAYLYWLKAQALIGLNRIEEALPLLDEVRFSTSKYNWKADSLYKSLNR